MNYEDYWTKPVKHTSIGESTRLHESNDIHSSLIKMGFKHAGKAYAGPAGSHEADKYTKSHNGDHHEIHVNHTTGNIHHYVNNSEQHVSHKSEFHNHGGTKYHLDMFHSN